MDYWTVANSSHQYQIRYDYYISFFMCLCVREGVYMYVPVWAWGCVHVCACVCVRVCTCIYSTLKYFSASCIMLLWSISKIRTIMNNSFHFRSSMYLSCLRHANESSTVLTAYDTIFILVLWKTYFFNWVSLFMLQCLDPLK